jgi:hypothetical protein
MGDGPPHGDLDQRKLSERLAYTPQVRATRRCRIRCWAFSLSFAITRARRGYFLEPRRRPVNPVRPNDLRDPSPPAGSRILTPVTRYSHDMPRQYHRKLIGQIFENELSQNLEILRFATSYYESTGFLTTLQDHRTESGKPSGELKISEVPELPGKRKSESFGKRKIIKTS